MIVETSGRMFIGDHIGPFSAGQLFMTGAMVPHNWITDPADYEPVELRDMLIQFEHQKLLKAGEHLPELNQFDALFDMSSRGILVANFDPAEARSRLASIRDSIGIKRLMNFVDLLVRLDSWGNKQLLSSLNQDTAVGMDTHNQMADVIEYIAANYFLRFNIKQLAERFNMTQKNLSQSFRRHTGSRIIDFINRIRIEQARKMLMDSSILITDICYKVGFNNVANFNRTFRLTTGMSPRQYRKAQNDSAKNSVVS